MSVRVVGFAVLVVLMSWAGVALCAEDVRLLPFGKSLAGAHELPLPFGVSVTLHKQDQDYKLRSLTVNLPLVDNSLLQNLAVKNSTGEANLKLDVWVLPFLNVFGLVGRIEGETKVAVQPVISDLTIDYEGIVYGAGVTAAGGVGRYFASLTAIYTDTSLDATDSSVTAWVLAPRVGGTFATRRGQALTCWIGAMYQQADEQHEGAIGLPGFGDVQYAVELEDKDPWNATLGASTVIHDRLSLELEVGAGGRTQTTGSLTWRF